MIMIPMIEELIAIRNPIIMLPRSSPLDSMVRIADMIPISVSAKPI
ncbi:hypothetical protein [Aporhodopirellula aestuarii]|uniref:Uncharacterized protein n=1 Tax=Aporhodopirellula aestuarii TaxID=2950107 RepID=A0ABT0UBZ4_9BACT|nr:hypothetical protein [Aporhodopirellula aestuarii]MCM2374430.1 hypothetical protein [Aporhodopirellula aestuarii]